MWVQAGEVVQEKIGQHLEVCLQESGQKEWLYDVLKVS